MRLNYIAIALFACGGCVGEADIGLLQPSSGQKTFRIVNGQRLPLHLELEVEEKRSIGFLAEKRDGEEYCTVSIVGPRHVVTAAHCVANVGVEDLFIGFGENPAAPDFRFDIDKWKVHPDRDFVVLITESEILRGGEVQNNYSFKAFDHMPVVDDFMSHINRCAVSLERLFDDKDSAIHPSAKTAGHGEQDSESWFCHGHQIVAKLIIGQHCV